MLGYSPYYCIDAFVLTSFFIESCIVMTNYLPVETFIARWRDGEGGQERANYALFLSELCDILDVPRPDPAGATHENNDYVLERVVKLSQHDGSVTHGRIDLYRRGCFVLEAKQSRLKGASKEVSLAAEPSGKWDVLMRNAHAQARQYAQSLPTDHGWPPFILVCDVGRVIEVYADFSGQGKNYAQFPDRQTFRISLDDLRKDEIRDRLKAIWLEPMSLDPARITAKVTREIAERLAKVSMSLENHHETEDVAMFLMRCLFTMFAEDIGLLPAQSFKTLLEECERKPELFQPQVEQLWDAMDKGEFAHAIKTKVKKFNGEFFKNRSVMALDMFALKELREAASADWRDVDPSIFGTLLESALDSVERKKLGAHYTPRTYVERLVAATVLAPLQADWRMVLMTVERQKSEGRTKDAIASVQAFHDMLCNIRVLDPACGTGNFLYVALEMVKRLEGEVLEALADLGGMEALTGLESHTVDPHQFLGIEINPRAAAIAELVLWIGHLQWYTRIRDGEPSEPILKAFRNIKTMDAVLSPDHKKRPVWPDAEFIVGNPPFIGGKDVRARLGDSYAEALWAVHGHMNESADFVMYWWDRAAELLTRKGTVLRRFGFVTTNSITQVFQRRVMEPHLNAKKPISLVLAIADHPWTKASRDAAAVRIAMTVAEAGQHDGILREVVSEVGLDTDTPALIFTDRSGRINSDLTVGVDVTQAVGLRANDDLCTAGVKLHGSGFIISPVQAQGLGLGSIAGLDQHIRHYRNGRDLMARPRGVMVIDLFGLDAEEVRRRFPAVYQQLKLEVKEKIITKSDGSLDYVGRDWNNREYRRDNWWLFGENVPDLRKALKNLPRYIATVETAKHRIFQFLDASILPDNMLVAIATDDASHLGILSSRIHTTWALFAGGTLEDRPRYSKSRCFDPFPFPAADEAQKQAIRAPAEELDALRKTVLDAHEHLTLTKLYNVLEEVKAGTAPADLSPVSRRIYDDGLVGVLAELHDRIDRAVCDAYGWPANLTVQEILGRLVALNAQRAKEEAIGKVLWLRPDYQIPRLGTLQELAELDLVGGSSGGSDMAAKGERLSFSPNEMEQTALVIALLQMSNEALSADAVAMGFKQGRRVLPKVEAVLAASVRMGLVSSGDGKLFTLRKVA